jgi:transcriptional regulator with XRE-family HTH domain
MDHMADRRADLAAFLRSRRGRITPEDAGLAPGLRRRTPGLRREEVAQLAGVGVTWYTWLEQGRPINASPQVLDAISRTLRLDPAERLHLYRLADVPGDPKPGPADDTLPAELQQILDQLDPIPASIVNPRYDLLAQNRAYTVLFPRVAMAAPHERNLLWQIFVCHGGNPPFLNRDTELRIMVANLRGAFGRHLTEPSWAAFIRNISAASPEFALMWSAHEVAEPTSRVKRFLHPGIDGEIRLLATSLAVSVPPESRMVVYTPVDEAAKAALSTLDKAASW